MSSSINADMLALFKSELALAVRLSLWNSEPATLTRFLEIRVAKMLSDTQTPLEISGSPFSISRGYANNPRIYVDHIEIPLDGTMYLKSKGDRRKFERDAPAMPAIDQHDPN